MDHQDLTDVQAPGAVDLYWIMGRGRGRVRRAFQRSGVRSPR
jgi:hypothetical protein